MIFFCCNFVASCEYLHMCSSVREVSELLFLVVRVVESFYHLVDNNIKVIRFTLMVDNKILLFISYS